MFEILSWEAIIALFAVIASLFSIYTQRAHNRLTHKPIPVIVKYNYKNLVRVRLWNKGTGPLFIERFKVKDKESLTNLKTEDIQKLPFSKEDKNSLINFVPVETRQLTYVDFIDTLAGRIITPGESLNLLEFKIREDKDGKPIEGYAETLNVIKHKLHGCVIMLEYSNVYKNKMKYVCNQLDFDNLVDETKATEKNKQIQGQSKQGLHKAGGEKVQKKGI
ncbi:MAG: hypothetical protein GY751_19420 [Bacteroidetes bacterium]|nr:hypothetical protein [Bacteroidota bacterium]